MPTFAELLTAHIARTGIGDADLARRVRVSRLTLIRWKEGVTSRPRYREDVVRCAELLRLTPEERNELLLAAEFLPEDHPPDDAVPEAATPGGPAYAPGVPGVAIGTGVPENRSAAAPRTFGRRRNVRIVRAAAVAAAVALAIGVAAIRLASGPDYPVAAAGESLIVIAPFANYTAGQQGFNVPGRLKDSIDREVVAAGLSGVRTVEWPEEISGGPAASAAGRRSGASIVIWGEYDSGRVVATLTVPRNRSEPHGPQVVDIASSPSELPTAINIDLTAEVRSLALLTLSQLYLEQREFDRAKTVLIQALAQPPSDPAALSGLRYRLGRAYLGGDLADLDEAIWLFSQVLAVQPRSVDSYNSRGLAYLERGRPGDVDLAIADLSRAAAIMPQLASPFFNRAVAYLDRGQPGDLRRALDDLEQAIAAGPESAGAFVNRSAVYLERGEPGDLERAFDDLKRAIEIQPELATAWVNRGNAYLQRGQEGDPGLAVADFTKAIELSPDSAMGYYNRGLVYSAIEEWERSTSDLRMAQELDPGDPKVNNALCWQLGVQRQPELALPYCNLALADAPDGPARDSRGLVHGVMGRDDEAIADFQAFLAWADASVKESCRIHFRPSREAWIAALQRGDNPFDAATLRDLRVRPAMSRDNPC